MDDLADILTKIHTKENADADWKFITKQIREMPPYRVPQLWGALLQNLAREPPAMPQGYITSDQWMSMCIAQYHELYRCACKDAGMEVSSVGNSGGRVEGGVNTSSIDLSSVTSQLAKIQGSLSQSSTADITASKVHTAIGGDISAINQRHNELRQMIEDMKTQQTSEQDTIRQIITDMAANKAEGEKKLDDVSIQIEKRIEENVTQPIQAVAQQIETFMSQSKVSMSGGHDGWIEIEDANVNSSVLTTVLTQKARYLIYFSFFKDLFKPHAMEIDFTSEQKKTNTGQYWFWKNKKTTLFIRQSVIGRILDPTFMFAGWNPSNESLRTQAHEMLRGIEKSTSNGKIPSPLLALILNRYSFQCRATGKRNEGYVEYKYDDIPFKPETYTEDGNAMYKLCENVSITEILAREIFDGMYISDSTAKGGETNLSQYNPFKKDDPTVDPSAPLGPLKSALGTEWDADEWFETELSNPSKQSSQIQADKWFSSIATTINERSASPRKQLEQRSASPTKADIWFTSIASTISKRSASPSKRSASPSKVPLSTRSISPTAATLTSS